MSLKEGMSIILEHKYVGTVRLLDTKIDQRGKKIELEHAYGKSPEEVIRALRIKTRKNHADDEIRIKKTDGTNYINCGIYSLKTGERYYKIDLDLTQVSIKDRADQKFIEMLHEQGAKSENTDDNKVYYYLTKNKEDIAEHPLYKYADHDKLINSIYDQKDKPRMIINIKGLEEPIGCESVNEAIKTVQRLNKTRPENEKITEYELRTFNENLTWINRLGEEVKGAYTNKETYRAIDGKNITPIYLDARKIESNNEFIIDSNRFMDKYRINFFESKRKGDKKIYYVQKCDYTPWVDRFRNNTRIQAQTNSKPIVRQNNIVKKEQMFTPPPEKI